jgi:primase-polymerase (primpol)-like protein
LAGGIPDELKSRWQWVAWKYAFVGKKWTKHPFNPQTGRKASSTDLLTWSDFEKALRAYEVDDYDGVGFAFCSGDPYVGVDLDGCVDPETGEVETWALQVIEGLDSYTELSPSGTGVHIIARGKIPHGGRRGSLEMYAQDRFFCVTGHLLGEED